MPLTAAQVRGAKPGEKLSDGNGLRLDVDASGNRTWVLRFKSPITGKERYMGLGSASVVRLADARKKALAAQKQILDGLDPIEHRKAQRTAAKADAAKSTTFRMYADQFISGREAGWKNGKHRQQWPNSLRDYVHPHIGSLPVADVDTEAVLKVLRPIWSSKKETARRIRGRIEAILNAAKAEGLRSGENPALWRGHLDQVLPRRRKKDVKHHPALPYDQHPQFMRSLRADTSDSALVLQFIILTAARYNEGASAEWSEINRKSKLWTIPAAKMKAEEKHVVPLSDAALKVLDIAQERFGDSGLVFPGATSGKPISDVSLANAIKRHTNTPATTHGFRSTFRDWAGDMTNFPRDVCEQALAHALMDETEAAYRRSDALAKRRLLMDEWAMYSS